MSSAICFNLDQSKILSSGIWLSRTGPFFERIVKNCGHLYVILSPQCFIFVKNLYGSFIYYKNVLFLIDQRKCVSMSNWITKDSKLTQFRTKRQNLDLSISRVVACDTLINDTSIIRWLSATLS